jgi:hypothetical protein
MQRLLSVCLLVVLLPACNTVGPQAVRGARINYNEAIARTGDQQLLLNLVRLKYRDTPLFLEITNVSTQYNLEWSAGASQSFSDTDTLASGLSGGATGVGEAVAGVAVNTLGGTARATSDRGGSLNRTRVDTDSSGVDVGLGFYERPTVTYSPLQGEQFVTQLLSPISLNKLVLMAESGWSLARIFRLCLQDMNGLDNASAASGPTPEYVPKFEEFQEAVEIMRRLQIEGAIEFVTVLTEEGGDIYVEMRILEGADPALVKQLRDALNLAPDKDVYRMITMHYDGIDDAVALRSRSLLAMMHFMSQGVEPPKAHVERGLVTQTVDADGTPFDWDTVTGDFFKIRSHNSPPPNAFVRVRYRGAWFYIDDSDLESKTTFGLLGDPVQAAIRRRAKPRADAHLAGWGLDGARRCCDNVDGVVEA